MSGKHSMDKDERKSTEKSRSYYQEPKEEKTKNKEKKQGKKKRKWLKVLGIILLVIILKLYNDLVKARNNVRQAKSGIDIYLNQRFDLIPNLVECVKGYSKHEKSIFTEIANLRSAYMKQPKNIKSAETLNNKMNQLIAVAENYPELKASEQYLNLQKNLTKIESQLQAARRIYNLEVTNYNTKLDVVPSNLIASLFGFEHAQLFEIEDYKRENINIKIEE